MVWTIHEATPADLGRIRDLYFAVRGDNRPAEYDRWRFTSAPDGFCPTALAVDGDRVVGLYTLWPVRLKLGNEIVLGGQSMDSMSHPDYLGQGVFTKLAMACYEIAQSRGFKVLYGFPNPLSYPGFIRRLNWDHTGDITHWVRPLKLSLHPKLGGPLGAVADIASRLLPKGNVGGFTIRTNRPDDSLVQALLDNWCQEADLCLINRTPDWFHWRYSKAAENDYRWVCAYQGDTLSALAIWGQQNKAWGEGQDHRAHLVELLGISTNAVRAALAATITEAASTGAMVIETVSNVKVVTDTLRRANFFRHRQAPLIVRSLTTQPLDVNIHNHSAWRFMGGDLDTF
jgi:GNAT superfamily N-acetyltransferase